MRLRRAKILDRGGDGFTGERAALRRRQFQFFLPVDDGAGFEQQRRHAGIAQHDQLVVAVDAGVGIEQLAPAIAHQGERVMRRELQAARLQRFSQEFSEQQAAGAVGIVIRDEEGIARIVVVVLLVLALVLPGVDEIVGHRIVMNRNKQVGRKAIGDHRPLEQPDRWRFGSDEQNGLVEAGIDQRLFDLLCQLQIEGIFRHAAGTQRAWHVEGVADIDDNAEGRGLAVRMRRCGGSRRRLFAAGQTRVGGPEQNRKRAKQNSSGVPRVHHVARLPCLIDSAKPTTAPITSFAALVHA